MAAFPLSDNRRTRIYAGGALGLMAFIAYWNSLGTPFAFDDVGAIVTNPTIQEPASLRNLLLPPVNGTAVMGRPVVNLSLALNYALGGNDVHSFHAFNLGVHLLAALALFGVVRRTKLLTVSRGADVAKALPFAWLVAAVWLLHPLQTESVTCIVQRTELLVGLFYLVTLYGVIRSAENPTSKIWPICAIGSCLLGMASKEVMVSAPVIILLYDRIFLAGSWRTIWTERRALHFGLAATWLLLAALLFHGGGTRGVAAGFGLGVSPFAYALKQCEAIPLYLWRAFWPHPLILDYGEDLSTHLIRVWAGALFLLFLGAATLIGLRHRPALGFLGLWFLAILAPSSSIVPLLTQTMAEHRMYLPLAAVAVATVALLGSVVGRRGFATYIVVLGLLIWLTVNRNVTYRSGITLWQDTVAKVPFNSRAHYNLGLQFALLPGREAEAMACFKQALACDPTNCPAHVGLAIQYANLEGGHPAAIAHYEAALRIWPDHVGARVGLANELVNIPARVPEAIAHYEAAIRLQPGNSIAHNNLANALAKIPGQLPKAIAHYEYALALRPDDPELHFNFANLLAHIPERQSDTLNQYATALRLRPDFFQAHLNLANVLANLSGRAEEAIAHYRAALQLQPNHRDAHYNLGVILANHHRIAEAIHEFETVIAIDPGAEEAKRIVRMLQPQGK